ncbi:unnamed protein product [Dicrocoelium dendriticum]|nr:unnamed protein product [Dicrocoelium dendriticum]
MLYYADQHLSNGPLKILQTTLVDAPINMRSCKSDFFRSIRRRTFHINTVLLALVEVNLLHLIQSDCVIPSDKILATYELREETHVPIQVADITQDIRGDLEPVLTTTKMVDGRFILFPSAQPFSGYFELRDMQVTRERKISHRPVNDHQLLVLTKKLDLEMICNTKSVLYQSGKIPLLSDNTCECRPGLAWCSIFLHFAVIEPHSAVSNQISGSQSIADGLYFSIELRIMDVNDNFPKFCPSNYSLTILESENPGTSFRLPSATDEDLGETMNLVYKMIFLNASSSTGAKATAQLCTPSQRDCKKGPQYTFSLHHVAGTTDLFLLLNYELDAESFDTFFIHITATDQASPKSHDGLLLLQVKVMDVNDNSPQFKNSRYTFSVSEGATPGSTVGSVYANDADQGDNGKVTYHIMDLPQTSSDSPEMHHRFRLESDTGVFKVDFLLDREENKAVYFRVIARDNGHPVRSSICMVLIYLEDENDNSPVIRVWTLSSNENEINIPQTMTKTQHPASSPLEQEKEVTIRLSEWSEVHSLVAVLEVYDIDAGENGKVSCTLYGSDYFMLVNRSSVLSDRSEVGIFHSPWKYTETSTNPNGRFYSIFLLKSIDRETQPLFTVEIVCIDSGAPVSRSSSLVLFFAVQDENDNAPVFGLPVVIKPAQWLNKKESYSKALSSVAFATDKEHPLSFDGPIEVSVPETMDLNHTFIRFVAHDADVNSCGAVSFRLVGRHNPNVMASQESFLIIDHRNGAVSLDRSLRAITPNKWFNFEVIAEDEGNPKLSTVLLLSIYITVVNQHSPRLELKPLELFHLNTTYGHGHIVKIFENLPPGVPLCKLTITDPDRSEAGQVAYWLDQSLRVDHNGSYSKESNTFLLNQQTGVITSTGMIDREVDGEHFVLIVIAHDHGRPRKTRVHSIDVYIADVNDNHPTFVLPPKPCFDEPTEEFENGTSVSKCTTVWYNRMQSVKLVCVISMGHYTKELQNSANLFQSIVQFEATDDDVGENALVTYRLAPPCDADRHTPQLDNTLNIDKHSGCLKVHHTMIQQAVRVEYLFRVIAEDSGSKIKLRDVIHVEMLLDSTSQHMLRIYVAVNKTISECTLTSVRQQTYPTNVASHSLTPVVRVLVTLALVTLGIIVVVVIVSFSRQLRPLSSHVGLQVSRQPSTIHLYQCHAVHNQINEQDLEVNASENLLKPPSRQEYWRQCGRQYLTLPEDELKGQLQPIPLNCVALSKVDTMPRIQSEMV